MVTIETTRADLRGYAQSSPIDMIKVEAKVKGLRYLFTELKKAYRVF